MSKKKKKKNKLKEFSKGFLKFGSTAMAVSLWVSFSVWIAMKATDFLGNFFELTRGHKAGGMVFTAVFLIMLVGGIGGVTYAEDE